MDHYLVLMVSVHVLGAPDVASAAANTALPPKTSATYDYSEALHKTLIFFESMRSGVLDRQRLAWWALTFSCNVAAAMHVAVNFLLSAVSSSVSYCSKVWAFNC